MGLASCETFELWQSALNGYMNLSSLPWEVLVRVCPVAASERRKAALEWDLESGHCHKGGWKCECYRRNENEKCKSKSEIFKLYNMSVLSVCHCQETMGLLEA